jgi:hypothetical protein
MLFYSVSVNLDFKIVIQPEEPNETVPAEDCTDRYMASLLESALKVFVGTRGMCRIGPAARMAVEVGEQSVAELL